LERKIRPSTFDNRIFFQAYHTKFALIFILVSIFILCNHLQNHSIKFQNYVEKISDLKYFFLIGKILSPQYFLCNLNGLFPIDQFDIPSDSSNIAATFASFSNNSSMDER